MVRPDIPPVPPPPPRPHIAISPGTTSITINSGQSETLTFTVEKTEIFTAASLAVGSVPAGITASLSPSVLEESQSQFSLTLTAADNLTPAAATIDITATASGLSATATVAVNALAVGQVFPRYQILALLYGPPGTNGGHSTSQVQYGTGSTTGTTDSTSNSFKAGVNVSANVGFGKIGPVNLGVTADFTASQTSTETSQVNIDKGSSNQISVAGPAQDGISHNNDLFYLWLNPLLNVTIDHLGNVTWQPGVNGTTMEIQYVYVEWLLNPSLMPPGVAGALANAGLTTADYANILACNPFSSGGTAIDPNRFVPTTHTNPYEPPLAAGDAVPTMTYTQTSATTTTNTEQVQVQYGVSITVTAGFNFIFSEQLKATGTLQWTNTSTSTATTGSSQSATVTVGGPAFGYTGPTDVQVYWDTVYSSWMFAFVTESPSASGTVTSAGAPLANQPVTLTAGGITLSTFTTSTGTFNFYGGESGQGTLTVKSQQFPVAIGRGEPPATIHLT